MRRKSSVFGEFEGGRIGIALLMMRVVAGAAMIIHGLPKIQNPMGWQNAAGFANPAPGFLQALAAVAEVCGGAAWILGLLTPVASLGLFCTMVGAILFHAGNKDPWISAGGKSWELAGLYLVVSLLLLIAGAGRYSLDYVILGRDKR
jgi:putative oxidoreductase